MWSQFGGQCKGAERLYVHVGELVLISPTKRSRACVEGEILLRNSIKFQWNFQYFILIIFLLLLLSFILSFIIILFYQYCVVPTAVVINVVFRCCHRSVARLNILFDL